MPALLKRRTAQPGDRYGHRVLVERVKTGVGREMRDSLWRWKCDCGRTGKAYLNNFKRSKSCVECAPYHQRDAHNQHGPVNAPAVLVGTIIGGFEVLRVLDQRRYRKRVYDARCVRCGATHQRTSDQMRNCTRFCPNCRNKHKLLGKLLTWDEISTLFGVKKSLLLHRTGRKGMSVEEAVFTPVRTQKAIERKQCPKCKRVLAASTFRGRLCRRCKP